MESGSVAIKREWGDREKECGMERGSGEWRAEVGNEVRL